MIMFQSDFKKKTEKHQIEPDFLEKETKKTRAFIKEMDKHFDIVDKDKKPKGWVLEAYDKEVKRRKELKEYEKENKNNI